MHSQGYAAQQDLLAGATSLPRLLRAAPDAPSQLQLRLMLPGALCTRFVKGLTALVQDQTQQNSPRKERLQHPHKLGRIPVRAVTLLCPTQTAAYDDYLQL
jgi:hypothetical protein